VQDLAQNPKTRTEYPVSHDGIRHPQNPAQSGLDFLNFWMTKTLFEGASIGGKR